MARMVLVGGAACEPAGDGAPLHVADSAGVRITTIGVVPAAVEEWRLATTPRFVVTGAEAGDSAAFAQVGGVRWIESGRVVVGDVIASRLFLFDSTGLFLRAFGRQGDGPGELRRLGSITAVAADSVVTFDAALLRLSVWHPDTGFVRSTQLRGESSPWAALVDAWPWQDSAIVALHVAFTPWDSAPPSAEQRRSPSSARLTLRDAAGNVMQTSPLFDGMYTVVHSSGDTRAPFSHRPFAVVATDRIYFGSGESYVISKLNTDFAWTGDLRWPRQREALTAGEVEQVQADLFARLGTSGVSPRRRASVERSFAPEALPQDRPAIERVLIAPDGRLWVERFVPERLGSALPAVSDRWTVLEADGRPVARLRLPPGVRLEAVRGSQVAVVVRDSLDVQHVAVYDVVRP